MSGLGRIESILTRFAMSFHYSKIIVKRIDVINLEKLLTEELLNPAQV